MPWFLGGMHGLNLIPYGVVILICWSIFWKGLALWYAARRGDKWWFCGLLIVNTMGIIEMCYLLFVAKAFSKTKTSKRK